MANRERFLELMGEILERRWFSNDGPVVRDFESAISRFLGVKHCIATCNATVALEIAAKALGLEAEVIVPSFTFVATAHALQWLGITPVFCDVDPGTHNIDPAAVERLITSRSTGILGVHLWGTPCEIEVLQEIADRHELALFFDAAHAFGCTYAGEYVGRFGRCEIFSFHATKFLHSFEGGAITTDDDELAENARRMRNFGFEGYDNVVSAGINGKMSEPCAAMGLTNLECIEGLVESNRQSYRAYCAGLEGIPGIRVVKYDERETCNFQFVVLELDSEAFGMSRDELVDRLQRCGVLARKYFWPGVHRMEAYRSRLSEASLSLSNTEWLAERVVTLPAGTAVDKDEISGICSLIRGSARD
ncbi:MAG: aminotransferase class I/II-fold pyridoxal phosphate-dependent enzyme [Acidobacteriota bacterium]|nr:aminotransferase class I/II-fold pyridoxal phosphate-dependent enzyme [Acidobacteriota bacterium]